MQCGLQTACGNNVQATCRPKPLIKKNYSIGNPHFIEEEKCLIHQEANGFAV